MKTSPKDRRLQTRVGCWLLLGLAATVLCTWQCAAEEKPQTTEQPAERQPSSLPSRSHAAAAGAILEASGVRGGLVVHLGCGDGELTAALRAGDGYLVHGLERDRAKVTKAQDRIEARGLYGPVSVDQWLGTTLPYVDNSVNLIVVEEPAGVSPREIDRVLCPGGVACLKHDGQWTRRTKPWPADIDHWSHCLHGPDNNAVADDAQVGPPRSLQWVGSPAQARQHENLASVSVVVSAGGRVFSIQDESSAASLLFLPRWFLVARDAFNGVILWKRPIDTWESHLRPFRMGPADLARRLVAADDRVFVTLGYGKPVCALDAATGQLLTEYPETAGACEIICCEGVLYVVAGEMQIAGSEAGHRAGQTLAVNDKRIVAVDSRSGRVLWQKSDAQTADLMANTLAASGGCVFFQNPREIVCLHAADGTGRWQAERQAAVERPGWSSPTLVVYEDVVLSADRALPAQVKAEPRRKHRLGWIDAPQGELVAFSVADGRRLWSVPCREGFHAPPDVLVADGLVWTGEVAAADDPGITVGRNPRTGQVERSRPHDREFFQVGMPHHRCHRNRATNHFLVLSRAGVELIELATGRGIPNHWVRGTCQYGVLPCNGLLYVPPHSCACYTQAKLNGFYALSPRQSYLEDAQEPQHDPPAEKQQVPPTGTVSAAPAAPLAEHEAADDRLQRGPAYGAIAEGRLPDAPPPEQWPTFRHDWARSGSTPSPLGLPLAVKWETALGGPLTSLTASDGRVYVAAKDRHCLYALNGATGKVVWRFRAGGRIDSPPTVLGQWLWFGAHDGSIYCLRAEDGQLAWRFRAAPLDRRAVVFGQLESLWPVPGSVLVRRGVAWAVAGRCSYLDGGLVLWRLDAATGRVLSQIPIDDRDPTTGFQSGNITGTFDIPGLLPDVLSADDALVYLRQAGFDLHGRRQADTLPHLFSPTGLLDDSWWHRSYWIFGKQFYTGYRDWFRAGLEVPAGRMLVFDEAKVYGFGRRPEYFYWSTPLEYHLFSCAKQPTLVPFSEKRARLPEWGQRQIAYHWQTNVPVLVRAMVLAGPTLLVAGPPQVVNEREAMSDWFTPARRQKLAEQEESLAGSDGAVLLAVSAEDGSIQARRPLDAPLVFDGMIAADGRLLMATTDGKVICLAAAER